VGPLRRVRKDTRWALPVTASKNKQTLFMFVVGHGFLLLLQQ
jgi:hypothetical protein